jgi:DNA-binding protein HU-beta
LNKSDLVSRVSIDANLSKRDAEEAINATIAAITGAVAKGEKVGIPGFGTFERRKRAARTARNPQTGATIKVAATSVPAFKAGQGFKEAVSGKKAGGAKKATAKKAAPKKSAAKKKR